MKTNQAGTAQIFGRPRQPQWTAQDHREAKVSVQQAMTTDETGHDMVAIGTGATQSTDRGDPPTNTETVMGVVAAAVEKISAID